MLVGGNAVAETHVLAVTGPSSTTRRRRETRRRSQLNMLLPFQDFRRVLSRWGSPRLRRHMQLDPRLLLQIADDAEEVAGLRIAAGAEHADQAFGGGVRRLTKLFEADRRLDVVAQDRLAGLDIAGQHR